MAADNVAPLLDEQKNQLVSSLSDAATSLHRAAIAAERFSRIIEKIEFAGPAADQQAQLLAALAATKDLQAHFASIANEESKKKRKRPKGDPNAPKKPKGAYMGWMNEHRKELEEKHPELTYKQLMGLAGTEWKRLTDKEKAPYLKKYEQEKVEFHEKNAAYQEALGLVSGATPDVTGKPQTGTSNSAAAQRKVANTTVNSKQKGTHEANAAAVSSPTTSTKPTTSKAVTPSDSGSEDDSDGEEEGTSRSDVEEVEEVSEADSSEEESEPQPPKKKSKTAAPASKAPAQTSKSAPAAKDKKRK